MHKEKYREYSKQYNCEDYLSGLNEEQRKAVLHREGPMLVTAGPGSGKTHVITTRLIHMICQYNIPPEKILVITFTKEAARSMCNRFQSKIHSLQNTNLNGFVSFGTFHSVYYQIVRSIPLYSQYRLIYEKEKKYILFKVLKQFLKNNPAFSFMSPSNTEKTYSDNDIGEMVEDLTAAISYYKNTLDLEEAAKKAEWNKVEFMSILKEYDIEKERKKTMDFDDMLYVCFKSLRDNNELLNKWKQRFDYYLVDEFQDCNPVQYYILKMLSGQEDNPLASENSKNLFVVGDDDQAIYGFRGADSMILQRFLKDFPTAVEVTLGTNYRCAEKIVRASVKVINENTFRIQKELTAVRAESSDEKVMIRKWKNKYDMYQNMSQHLKSCLKEELENHAVLFRTNQEMQIFALELMKNNIPFAIKDKGLCIYEHFLAKDIMAFLKAANGNRDRKIFLRILNKPKTHIGREAMEDEIVDFKKLTDFYNNNFMKNPEAVSDIKQLECQLEQLRRLSLPLGIRFIRKAMNYERYLKSRAGNNLSLFASWVEFLDWLTEDASSFHDLAEWETYQNNFAGKQNHSKESKTQNIKQKVQLMTMHASKGLEFEHCYIMNVNEGVIPKYQKGQKLTIEQIEEERRIFYVGMTRAKITLELHCINGTKEHPKFPSRFIRKLPEYE